jgi:predicted MFS family arabinose efflux permease
MVPQPAGGRSALAAWAEHLRNPQLTASFALVREPIGLSLMSLGFIYFVFLPSIFTTLLARGVRCSGWARERAFGEVSVAAAGLPLLIQPNLATVLIGLALVGIGTFFAQATATGFVSRAATGDRGSASGMYRASYFFGGLVGSAVLGQVFDRFGWGACVAGIGVALIIAAWLARGLEEPAA